MRSSDNHVACSMGAGINLIYGSNSGMVAGSLQVAVVVYGACDGCRSLIIVIVNAIMVSAQINRKGFSVHNKASVVGQSRVGAGACCNV